MPAHVRAKRLVSAKLTLTFSAGIPSIALSSLRAVERQDWNPARRPQTHFQG
jgi:hypothetical protein